MLDTESIYRLAWQQAASEMQFDMNDTLYANFVGHGIEECKIILIQIYGDSFPLADFLKRSLLICRQHIAEFGISIKPGLMELLDFAENSHIRKAIATSSGRSNALFCLGDLVHKVEVLVTRDDVVQGKPQPDLYVAAAQRLGLPIQECLALEDSNSGVQAACAANMSVIMVPDLLPPDIQTAAQVACVCASLHEVQALLQCLNES